MPFFPPGSGGGGGLGSPLVSTVLGAPASSIAVSGIPTTGFRNLLMIYGKAQGSLAAVSVGISIQFNGDSTIGHYGQGLSPGGSAVGFGSPGFQILIPATASGITLCGGGYMYLMNYADAANQVTAMGASGGRIGNAGTSADFLNPGIWNGIFVNGPVTSIALVAASGNILAGAYLEVFGIA